MSELFSEVDEELRREQLQRFLSRYSIYLVAAALLIIAGVGGWRGYQYYQSKQAAEASSAFEVASKITNPAEAEAAFDKIGAGTTGYRFLARLHSAAEAAKQDSQKGVQAFDAIAGDGAAGVAIQDIARLRAASLLVDTAPYDEINRRLGASTDAPSVFRHSARELLALSAWRANNLDAARKWLDMIGNDPETPATLRTRAEALQALLPPVAKS
ncbi:MAG: tetratricopeptide repeat protein [Xanthobacteraceae bacterium]|nr:tetratricopeptide repeat protein [Xanthobacteraceae bacterium]